MQHLPKSLNIDSHHDILSVNPKPESSRNLLGFLHGSSADVLDHLFNLEQQQASPVATENLVVEPMDVAPVEEAPTVVTVGQESRLSECALWQIQEDYYQGVGINAWEQDVPCFVTSSVYIADVYAEMVLAFIGDYLPHLNLDEPVYIVELATGTGRFSHMVLRELERKLTYFEALQNVKIRYIMTDFTESNPEFWQKHEKFQPFIDKGMLDFAVFRPETDTELNLRVSGETLACGNVVNPMFAISNYFFDSIRQDFFRVESKRLMEGLVTLERNVEGIDPATPPHISQIKQQVRYRELRNEHYYPDAKLNAVLGFYRHNVKNGSIIFPVGAFDVIRNMQTLSNNRLVLLSSDKAYSCHEHMTCYYEHTFATHSGAFSYMVNYDALSHYFQNEGGRSFMTTGRNLSLQTVCFVGFDTPDCKFERLQYLYNEKIDRSHPVTTNCSLLPEEREYPKMVQMDHMLSYVRLNLADPKIFIVLGQRIIDLIPHSTSGQQQDLLGLLDKAWESYYFFPGEVNLPFWASQIYHYLSMFQESNMALDKAIELFGRHEALYFLKGQNYEKLGQWKNAAEMYEMSLEVKPDLSQAHEALNNVRVKLR